MTPISAPELAPLVLPRTAAPPAAPIFTGAPPAGAATTPPRKPASGPNVTPPAATVTQKALRCAEEPLDPADYAALREVLETTGRFVPAPPDPPWEDPRPDLAADRSRWWLVLEAAYRLDGADPNGLYGALFGMRCCGARLELANAETWGARPEDPPPTYRLVRGDELSEAEYAELRQRYLVPHREALTRLLSAPSAAQIAHQRPAPAQPAAKFTGSPPAAAPAAPRKNGTPAPAAQPALLASEPARNPVPALDW